MKPKPTSTAGNMCLNNAKCIQFRKQMHKLCKRCYQLRASEGSCECFLLHPVEEEDFCFLWYFCICLHLVWVKPPLATKISGCEATVN